MEAPSPATKRRFSAGYSDPTLFLCQGRKAPPVDELVTWFSEDPSSLDIDSNTGEIILRSPKPRRSSLRGLTTESFEKLAPVYCDIEKWTQLNNRLDKVSHVVAEYARMLNPAEEIDSMSALNKKARAGIKAANIDAVFNMSGAKLTDIEPFDPTPLTFLDLAGGPGAFSQVIQYHFPTSRGWGISLKTSTVGCAWNRGLLDMTRFTILEGADGTGDLIANYRWVINEMRKFTGKGMTEEAFGVDLVMADGFIKPEDAKGFREEELINQNLIVAEIGVGIACLKPGHNMFIKIAETLRPVMAEAIWLAACAFEKVCQFKPLSSRPLNAEAYLVCKNRRADKEVAPILQIFENYWQQMIGGGQIKPVLGTLPEPFVTRLTEVNNGFLDRRLEIIADIEKLNQGLSVKKLNLDLHRAFIVWKMPMVGDWIVSSDFQGQACELPAKEGGDLTQESQDEEKEIYLATPNFKPPAVLASNPTEIPKLIAEVGRAASGQKNAFEATLTFLDQQIVEGKIVFPSVAFFLDKPEIMFNRLRQFNPEPIRSVQSNYYLKSYLPRSRAPKLYLPPLFNKESVYLLGNNDQYSSMDLLTDHFLEKIRLKTRRIAHASVMDYWEKPELRRQFLAKLLQQGKELTYLTMRNVLYSMTFESKHFRPTWALGLFKIINLPPQSRVLDMSSGWADRLIASIAANMDYTGFDPDEELTAPYQAIIKRFGDPKRHKIHIKPFEKATPSDLAGEYDCFLASPPFFTTELYPGKTGQSVDQYSSYVTWMKKFLFASLEIVWRHLKEGAYFCLHLGDVKTLNANGKIEIIQLCEAAQLFIEEKLINSSYEGIIGVSGQEGHARPVWVWRKIIKGKRKWRPEVARSLRELYPELVIY
jgi:23S rRNA U2552 (ribose-2'-O)-methylase RlmE/FtsJ